MKPENCVVCGSMANTHHDERKHWHVACPTCGSYIVAATFATAFAKVDEKTRERFANWMTTHKDNSKRFLYKTRPDKSNPYSAKDGFEMVSLGWINSEFGKMKEAPEDTKYDNSTW